MTEFYRQKGVKVFPEKTVEAVETAQGRLRVRLSGMNPIEVDGVVAGLGIVPNTQLAASAGLEVSDGIVVDELLRTSAKDVYAAGDVAAFHNPALGKRIRVEHEDNANTMGEIAGRNMACAVKRYDHLPAFYSDLFELGYEAVGELDSSASDRQQLERAIPRRNCLLPGAGQNTWSAALERVGEGRCRPHRDKLRPRVHIG